MKTRNGFVSNSSSSSFIAFGNTRDICETMLRIQYKESINDGMFDDTDQIKKIFDLNLANLESIRLDPRIMSGEIGLSFESSGYDTEIVKIDDSQCFVHTANYYSFSSELLVVRSSDDDESVSAPPTSLLMWLPNKNIYIKKHGYSWSGNATCKNCEKVYSFVLNEAKEICCGSCKSKIDIDPSNDIRFNL